jgi:hypothetical protein
MNELWQPHARLSSVVSTVLLLVFSRGLKGKGKTIRVSPGFDSGMDTLGK